MKEKNMCDEVRRLWQRQEASTRSTIDSSEPTADLFRFRVNYIDGNRKREKES
jgi:hypothetical protein